MMRVPSTASVLVSSLDCAKTDLAKRRRDRVVQVHDHLGRAFHCFKSPLDEFAARLHEHFNGDIGRNAVFHDQLAHEVEIRLRCRRKAHFDFLETHRHQHLEELELGFNTHWVSIRAWLPSRRSVLIQMGARSIVRVGYRRPLRLT